VRGARELSREFGAYLLVDEVATGIGRTGTMWAVEQAGVEPDLLTCGKGLTGGVLPLSAVLATDVAWSLESIGQFFRVRTHAEKVSEADWQVPERDRPRTADCCQAAFAPQHGRQGVEQAKAQPSLGPRRI
jgi:4-aminobutyrate aminotransferase-like enzyme